MAESLSESTLYPALIAPEYSLFFSGCFRQARLYLLDGRKASWKDNRPQYIFLLSRCGILRPLIIAIYVVQILFDFRSFGSIYPNCVVHWGQRVLLQQTGMKNVLGRGPLFLRSDSYLCHDCCLPAFWKRSRKQLLMRWSGSRCVCMCTSCAIFICRF